MNVLPIHIGIALGYFGNYIYMPHLVTVIGQRYSGTVAGFLIFLTFFGRLIASTMAGGFAERYGRKPTMIISILVEAFALLAYAFTTNLVLLSGIALAVGFSSGLSFPALKATLSELPVANRAKAFAQFILAQKMGMIGGALVGMIFTGAHFTQLFFIVFLIFIGYALTVGFFLKMTSPLARANPTAKIVHWSHPKEWEMWNGIGLFIIYALFWFLYSQFLVGMPLHIQWLAPSLPVTTPFWITGTVMLLGQVYLFKKFSARFQESQLMMLGMIGFVITFLFLGLGKTAPWVILASVLFVFGEMLFIPAFDVWLTNKTAADKVNRAMGTMHLFRSIGNMFGTCLGGITYDLAKSVNFPGLNWLLFAVIAFCCALFMYQRSPKTAVAADV